MGILAGIGMGIWGNSGEAEREAGKEEREGNG
jgi:hypothetical protein